MEIINGRVDHIDVPIPVTSFMDKNQRFLEENVHGGLLSLSDADTLANGDSITTDVGLGKVMLVVNAGSDMVGDVTITGTSVNRDTKAEEGSATDVLTLVGVSTDSSTTDTESNVIHGFTRAYISSKWFKGSITISTSEVNLSDVDVWRCSFEQFNDSPSYTLDTLDVTATVTHTDAWGYFYLYDIHVTGDQCNIENVGLVSLASADAAANETYRLRHSSIGHWLNGSTDGFWIEQHLGPNNKTYWEDLTVKVWTNVHIGVPI